MTLAITHTFQSAKGDGTDATLVRPSNWNAAHTTSMANLNLLGNNSGGVGAIQELPTTALVIAALNSADGVSFLNALGLGGFSVGDVKHSVNDTPATGWIVYQGGVATLGNVSSGATARANADTLNLFTLLWNKTANGDCPVSGGRGANPAADFAANKTIQLPWLSNRTIIGAGAGSPLTTHTNCSAVGEETHALTTAELAVHSHANTLNDPTHAHGSVLNASGFAANTGLNGSGNPQYGNTGNTGASGTGMTITNANAGSGSGHNNMQPSVALWTHMKL